MTLVRVGREGDITHVGFDRPQKRNALNTAMIDELRQVLDAATAPSILIFHSTTPGVFVSGADISELRDRNADDAMRRINGALFDRIATHRWPTIAVIDGAALGAGCEIALACDFRVASTNATFAQPELSLGIMAAAGANHRLARTAGLSVARQMLLSGATVDSERALECGLVDIVAEPRDVDAEAVALARRIARASWQALELTKSALALQAVDTSAFDAVGQAVLFESDEKFRRMDEFLARGKERSNPR